MASQFFKTCRFCLKDLKPNETKFIKPEMVKFYEKITNSKVNFGGILSGLCFSNFDFLFLTSVDVVFTLFISNVLHHLLRRCQACHEKHWKMDRKWEISSKIIGERSSSRSFLLHKFNYNLFFTAKGSWLIIILEQFWKRWK